MRIRIASEGELEQAAREFLKALGSRRHVALEGPMGAGKTTLVATAGRVLGMEDEATSPTFSIINEYRRGGGAKEADEFVDLDRIFHFDFYRIENDAQAEDLGLDEYFDSGDLCLMEWAGNVEAYLPEDTVVARISVQPDGSREIEISE